MFVFLPALKRLERHKWVLLTLLPEWCMLILACPIKRAVPVQAFVEGGDSGSIAAAPDTARDMALGLLCFLASGPKLWW